MQNMKFSEDWTNTRLFSIAFPIVNILARQLLYYVVRHYKHVCSEQQFLNDPSPRARVSCLLCTFTFINEMKYLVTVSRNQIKSELLFTIYLPNRSNRRTNMSTLLSIRVLCRSDLFGMRY